MILHTIGHSNLSTSELLRALKDHDVSYVVDVRSSPSSHQFPHFNRSALAAALRKVGIDYIYLGDKLGGKPIRMAESSEWKQGRLDQRLVSDLSRTSNWAEGLGILKALLEERDATEQSGCLLCSEADPNKCHRLLIAFELTSREPHLSTRHIRTHARRPSEVHFQKTLL